MKVLFLFPTEIFLSGAFFMIVIHRSSSRQAGLMTFIHYNKEKETTMTTTAQRPATQTMVLAAFFLALGLLMPFLVGQIPMLGNKLSPMHIPILLCGFVCGWQYGLIVGLVTPLLRSFLFGMPALMPNAAVMAFELAAYGAMTGILYEKLPKNTFSIYISLITAMITGRIVWGIVCVPIYGLVGKAFSFQIFLAGAFLNAIPGIILHIILIPAIVIALRHAKLLK
jgi:thiamine transporter ThiT